MLADRLLPIAPMLALLLWAAVQDVRTRKIRNWLTFTMALSGLLASMLHRGAVAPSQAGLGLLVGFAIPFVLFVLGALGGGDVKLLAGVGAWLGPAGAIQVFAAAAIAGMVIVLVQCTYQGKLFALLRNSAVMAISLVHVNQLGVEHAAATGQSCRSVDRPLPYALPVLMATVLVVLM
ncbi:MAG TPA: A24 family peptidase [Tepidisphaeraceae bacterium]|nr:A24 family peptidase [Tepidisphaeraceae bacterium]